MKRKGLVTLALVTVMSISSVFSGFAEWKQDNIEQQWNGIFYWEEYPTHKWEVIDKKFYCFGADGSMLHDTIQDGFYLGSDGACVLTDIGLPEVPYKAKLDALFANYPDIYNGTYESFGFVRNDYSEQIDAGSYYIFKNVVLGYWYDNYMDCGGIDCVELCHFDEIYVRKDGVFIYANQIYSLEPQEDRNTYLSRSNLIFDDKGYIIGWSDGGAS